MHPSFADAFDQGQTPLLDPVALARAQEDIGRLSGDGDPDVSGQTIDTQPCGPDEA
jgi:hypothetical protein